MGFQNGWLRKAKRVNGDVWVFCWRNGERKEQNRTIGPVSKFPKESDARREVTRLGLLQTINKDASNGNQITLAQITEKYLEKEHGEKSKKAKGTSYAVRFYMRTYALARFGSIVADEIKPKQIREWLYSLRDEQSLSGPTISKIKAIMHTVFAWGLMEEMCSLNPCAGWQLSDVESEYTSVIVPPKQTMQIIKKLTDPRHKMLVLLCSCCGLRASEACGLQWQDIDYEKHQIRIARRWTAADLDKPKTKASKAPVPMHPVLAHYLKQWRKNTTYAKDTDWVLPSFKESGRIPMTAGIFVTDYLRPAAIAAGVKVGERFGLHSFRSSLATWLTSVEKADVKTTQGMLRHADASTTLNEYAQSVPDEALAAQGRFLESMGLETDGKLLEAAASA